MCKEFETFTSASTNAQGIAGPRAVILCQDAHCTSAMLAQAFLLHPHKDQCS